MKTTKINFLKILLLFTMGIFLTNCSKDDDPPAAVLAPLQDPLAGYLTATGFSEKTDNFINSGDYEFGYSFIPLVNGKITDIVAKLPEARLAMRVTIWDKLAGSVLRTETIDVTTANIEATKSITALDLVKDKEYFITMNSNDWYRRGRTNGTSITYPITVGDIKITSYSYILGTAQALPNTPILTNYAGDCSFKFQK